MSLSTLPGDHTLLRVPEPAILRHLSDLCLQPCLLGGLLTPARGRFRLHQACLPLHLLSCPFSELSYHPNLSPKSHLVGTLNPLSLTLHIHIIQLQSVSPLKYFSDLYPNFSDPIALTQHSLLRTAFQPCLVYITSTLHTVGKGWAI